MSRSLKRLARRALVERQKDVYFHALMQLRREQQLDAILQHQAQQPVVVHTHDHDECHLPACSAPDYIFVSEDDSMPSPGPSSRDWLLVVMLVLGTAAMTLAICLLVFLAMNAVMGGGLVSGSMGSIAR